MKKLMQLLVFYFVFAYGFLAADQFWTSYMQDHMAAVDREGIVLLYWFLFLNSAGLIALGMVNLLGLVSEVSPED